MTGTRLTVARNVSSHRSKAQSTFGGGASSMADLDGLGGDVGLDMEIVDLAARLLRIFALCVCLR